VLVKEAVAGLTGLALVAFPLFGGYDGGMGTAAGAIGLILCLSVCR